MKSDFLWIPRIGVQDEKIEIPQTLSQQSPLETVLENTRLSLFDFIFSKIITFFFNFHLREAFKPPKKVRDILASWMETETNTMTFLVLNNFMILSSYRDVVKISREIKLKSDFLILGGVYMTPGWLSPRKRVHSGSLSWLYICLHDTTTKCHAGASHPGVSSPRFLYRGENFTPVQNLATVSCKLETTRLERVAHT